MPLAYGSFMALEIFAKRFENLERIEKFLSFV